MLILNGKKINMERFPNHETKVKDFENDIVKEQNVLEFRYATDGDLITLMFVKKRLDEFNVPCTLFVWYMPYSRMDRKIEGDLYTLQYVCEFINWLNFVKVVVMEPHSAKTMQLLQRAKDIYPVKDWLPIVQKEVGFTEKDHVVFSDKGAAARYVSSDYANVCIMEKNRNPLTGAIGGMYLKEGKVNPGAKCIIIDDLCSRGGTFIAAANILKSLGAGEIYLLVSHCEENVFTGILLTEESPIDRVYTSTSIMSKEHPNISYMDVDVTNYVRQ